MSSGIMQGESGSWIISLVIGIVIAVFLPGCTASQQKACPGQEPIIGTWFYDPTGSSAVGSYELTLFIIKEDGRFDATIFSSDRTKPLTYEIWTTGSWEKIGLNLYTLTGQNIRHDFITDNHTTVDYKNTVTYHPAKDILIPPCTVDSYGIFIRESCKPGIPPGLNVSIPWD